MKIAPFLIILGIAFCSVASAANYKAGDLVAVTRPVDLFFLGQLFQHAEEGDAFTVIVYRPAQKQLFVAARDKDGKDIALSVADDAVMLSPNSPPPSSPDSESQGIVLANTWDGPSTGNAAMLDDLGRLFSAVAKAAVNISPDPSILVYEGIPYLTPLATALNTLRLPARKPSKAAIICPGFPRDSLFYYAVDGAFEGKYNKMFIIVDRADQVVSIELIDGTQKQTSQSSGSAVAAAWRTFNFIDSRTRSMNSQLIDHKLYFTLDGKTWTPVFSSADDVPNPKASEASMFRVDSTLVAPQKRAGKSSGYRQLESVRWYVPKPLVELILSCTQASTR